MLVVAFVFLNLFIAVILESFNTSQTEEGLQIGQRTVDKFNDFWVLFDPKGKGFLNVKILPKLISLILKEEFNQLLDVYEEVEEGVVDPDDFKKMIFMFNLHRDEELIEIADFTRKRVRILKDQDKDVCELS